MRKFLLTGFLLAAFAISSHADGTRTVYTFDIERTLSQTAASVCTVHPTVMGSVLNTSQSFASALSANEVKLWGIQHTTGKFYGTQTNGTNGFKFTVAGIVVASTNKKAAITTSFTGSAFEVNTVEGMVEQGTTYTVREAFVNSTTADTLEYDFHITIGTKQSVVGDEPAYIHRADMTDDWVVLPVTQQNDGDRNVANWLQVNAGDKAAFGLQAKEEGDTFRFSVKNKDGKTVKYYNAKDFVIESATTDDAGYYSVSIITTKADGTRKTSTGFFVLDVQTDQGAMYDWAEHTPYWSYDFRDEYTDGFAQPTKVLNPYGSALTGYKADGWWVVEWGKLRRQDVTDEAIEKMLDKFNEDFAYIRDEMGWPPDKRARNGYYSTIVYFNSGLTSDDTTATGGWQGSDYYNGENWPNVLVSYYPIRAFDSKYEEVWQQNAMVHEGIHAVFADMNGVKNAAWFHEGGNTWLQQAMTAKRDGTYGKPGYLDACPFMAPFMPVECYSGWLQDGSFGGPSAEGVNMYENGTQICTWRNMLGGNQYGNGFATFLGEAVGQGSIPWIWRYCRYRVLQGIAEGNSSEGIEGIGDDGIRQLLLQYRAKQATFDLGGWSEGYRAVLNDNFGGTVKAEWKPYWINCAPWKVTPYANPELNDADGWLAPDTITNPGWSGGNQIPIHIDKEGTHAEVYFRPEDLNMRAQLCYRTKDGACYYSQPALCGKLELNWDESSAPANGVIFCVVANTDYIYEGDDTRKKHYDYRIKLGEGANAIASKDIKWYYYERTLTDEEYETGIEDVLVENGAEAASNDRVRLLSSVLRGGMQAQFALNGVPASDITAELVGATGIVLDRQPMAADATVQLPQQLRKGLYVLALRYQGHVQAFKVFVE